MTLGTCCSLHQVSRTLLVTRTLAFWNTVGPWPHYLCQFPTITTQWFRPTVFYHHRLTHRPPSLAPHPTWQALHQQQSCPPPSSTLTCIPTPHPQATTPTSTSTRMKVALSNSWGAQTPVLVFPGAWPLLLPNCNRPSLWTLTNRPYTVNTVDTRPTGKTETQAQCGGLTEAPCFTPLAPPMSLGKLLLHWCNMRRPWTETYLADSCIPARSLDEDRLVLKSSAAGGRTKKETLTELGSPRTWPRKDAPSKCQLLPFMCSCFQHPTSPWSHFGMALLLHLILV